MQASEMGIRMKARDRFEKLVAATGGCDDFARQGCKDGMFVSMAEGRRIWHGIKHQPRAAAPGCPSALKQAGWGGLAQ